MFKRAVTLFALIAMTFDHAVGGGGGQGEEWGDKKSDMLLDVETNLFDGEEDEMDQGLNSIHSSCKYKCSQKKALKKLYQTNSMNQWLVHVCLTKLGFVNFFVTGFMTFLKMY